MSSTRTATFERQFTLGPEIWRTPPFIIREVTRKTDNQRFAAKILMKFDHTVHEIESIMNELKFWRSINHPSLVQLSDYFDEEAFLYALYDYPPGGDLATLLFEKSRIFTEGFARIISHKILDALTFMHANGIVHGGCLPQNIMFMVQKGTHGWVNSCKLAFFYRTESTTRNSEPPSVFTDLKDLAFSLCCLLQKKAGLVERVGFDPFTSSFFRSAKDFDHLSDLCYSFIDSLWNAERDHNSAEKLRGHLWLHEHSDAVIFSKSIPDVRSIHAAEDGIGNPYKLCGWLHFKLSHRNFLGR